MAKDKIGLVNVFGTKSILLENYPDSAWDWISGRPEDTEGVKAMSEQVPWLFRGIRTIVQGVAEVPVCLMKGDDDVGYLGEDFESPFLYTEDLPVLLKKIAASLVLEGRSYLFREKIKGANVGMTTKKLWYWNPTTVQFDAQKTAKEVGKDRLLYFRRAAPGVNQQEYTNKEVIYFWPDDPYVEVGPPMGSPAKAALAAAGVLYNIDRYVSKYFEKGAVRAYMFSKEGAPPTPEQQTEFFKKMNGMVMGLRNAFRGIFISGDVKTEKIGDGLEGLQDSELTKEKREDISTALGIPQSILWSTESGGLGGAGVSTEDTYRFYRMNIVPSVRFICDVLNKQQLKDTGYYLQVRENDMDVFQEDEAARASSMGSLVSALEKPEEFLIAAGILGYDLSEDTTKEIEKLGTDRKEAAAAIQENMKPKEEVVVEKPDDETEDAAPEFGKAAEIHRLIKKAIKNIGKEWTFTSDLIPDLPELLTKLKACKNKEEINLVFDKPVHDYNPILEAMRLEMKQTGGSHTTVIMDTTGKAVETSTKTTADVIGAINEMSRKLDRPVAPPVVNVPAPIVNVEAPIVNVPAPIVNVEVKNEPDEANETLKTIRKLAKEIK